MAAGADGLYPIDARDATNRRTAGRYCPGRV